MSFILTLYDRNGKELEIGDIVKVQSDGRISFYAEVAWLEKEQALAPFHTFTFHSFEKADKLPENAIRAKEDRYGLWYVEDAEEDESQHEKYLLDWRNCEYLINERVFRIRPNPQLNLFK